MSIKRALFASFLILLCALATGYLSHPESVKLTNPLSTFPTQIGEWSGSHGQLDEKENEVLKADDTLLGAYTHPDGRRIQLFISFYRNQQEGKQIHSPRNCMPGAGWAILESSKEHLSIAKGAPEEIGATRLLLGKADEKQIMLYWLGMSGTYVASEYEQKLHLLVNSILRHRSDGAFIRLTARIRPGDDIDTFRHVKSFAELLVPVLDGYIPK